MKCFWEPYFPIGWHWSLFS